MSKFITLTILFSLFSFFNYSQLAVRKFENKSFSFNDQDSVFNIQVDCDSRAFGYFLSDTNTLEINQGLVLSTGELCSLIGPNIGEGSNDTLGYISQSNWYNTLDKYDVCIVEFDYITLKDSVKFNFQFGSDEYPEFVNSEFKDFFEVYLSGNEFQEPKNIAKINSLYISINSVNSSVNSDIYIDNTSNYLNIEFDGLTKKIAVKEKITPNLTYHLAFVIGDDGDAVYDTGVFIETIAENFTPDSLDYLKCATVFDSTVIKTNPPIIFPNPVMFYFSFAVNEGKFSDLTNITDSSSFYENFILTYKVWDELGNEILSEDLQYDELVFENGFIRSKKIIFENVFKLRSGIYFLELQSKVTGSGFFNYSYVSEKQFVKFIKK